MWVFKFALKAGKNKWVAHFEKMKDCGCGMETTTKLFDYKPTKEEAENEINN